MLETLESKVNDSRTIFLFLTRDDQVFFVTRPDDKTNLKSERFTNYDDALVSFRDWSKKLFPVH